MSVNGQQIGINDGIQGDPLLDECIALRAELAAEREKVRKLEEGYALLGIAFDDMEAQLQENKNE